MTTDGPWWRIGPDGRPRGPYTSDEIRALLRRGRLWCSDPVWTPDSGQWTPLDRTRLLDGRPGMRPPVFALAAAFLAYAAAVGGDVLVGTGDLVDVKDPPSLWILRSHWIGPALALAVTSFVFIRFALLSAARLRRRPRLAATLRMTAACCGVVGGLLALGSLSEVTTAPQSLINTARARFTVEIVPDTNRIVVNGSMGYGFAKAMRAALEKVADPVRIEIESPGGLAHEALKAAHAIEARPGATVVAGDLCESGCIVVLMGGTNRLAPPGGILGFHARSDVRAEAERLVLFGYDVDAASYDIPSDDYMIRRGVPADIVAETNRRGTHQIHNVPAELLLERGVLTGFDEPEKD